MIESRQDLGTGAKMPGCDVNRLQALGNSLAVSTKDCTIHNSSIPSKVAMRLGSDASSLAVFSKDRKIITSSRLDFSILQAGRGKFQQHLQQTMEQAYQQVLDRIQDLNIPQTSIHFSGLQYIFSTSIAIHFLDFNNNTFSRLQ